MEKIKLCPDCKSAKLGFIVYERKPLNCDLVPTVFCYSVFCTNCNFQGPVRKNKHLAIKAWNQLTKKAEKEVEDVQTRTKSSC